MGRRGGWRDYCIVIAPGRRERSNCEEGWLRGGCSMARSGGAFELRRAEAASVTVLATSTPAAAAQNQTASRLVRLSASGGGTKSPASRSSRQFVRYSAAFKTVRSIAAPKAGAYWAGADLGLSATSRNSHQ